MEETYWICGAELNYPPDEMTPERHVQKAIAVFESLALRSGVKPAWVDEIHWNAYKKIEALPYQALQQAGFPNSVPVFNWIAQPLLDHHLLQASARSIAVDSCRITALGQQVGCATSLCLLASPDAVGRYNLTPQARLALCFSIRCEPCDDEHLFRGLASKLESGGIDPQMITWLATTECRDARTASKEFFPASSHLAVSAFCPVGVIYQTNLLVQALIESEAQLGLLVTLSEEGTALATVIERI